MQYARNRDDKPRNTSSATKHCDLNRHAPRTNRGEPKANRDEPKFAKPRTEGRVSDWAQMKAQTLQASQIQAARPVETDFGQSDFGHPYPTDFGQSDFGQTDFGQR